MGFTSLVLVGTIPPWDLSSAFLAGAFFAFLFDLSFFCVSLVLLQVEVGDFGFKFVRIIVFGFQFCVLIGLSVGLLGFFGCFLLFILSFVLVSSCCYSGIILS